MKAQAATPSHVVRHRANLKQLVERLKKKPFDCLPERSVECLNQFFNGYNIFGPPVWRDLTSFEFWLAKRLFYPEDAGARWWRFIQLNSMDNGDSYELFCRLYSQYARHAPTEIQPTAPEHSFDPARFDFYQHLYGISKKPGLYLGSGDRVQLIAAYVAGYFKGKKDSHVTLTRDEGEFCRFEMWLRKTYRFARQYPWYRLVEMWPRERNSFQSFFAEFDAYLTDFGKKARGLEDLFEFVTDKECTKICRRKILPKEIIRSPRALVWWREQHRIIRYFRWRSSPGDGL